MPDGTRASVVSLDEGRFAYDGFDAVGVVQRADGTEEYFDAVPTSRRLHELAQRDAAVQKVLRLVDGEDRATWVGMFRLYEVIEADVGDRSSVERTGLVNKKDVGRFCGSANNVLVAGDAARHGVLKVKAPPDPMDLSEAIAFIGALRRAWLRSKGII